MEVEKLIKLFKGTQKEMAAKLGTTESRISEYKKGKHAIPVAASSATISLTGEIGTAFDMRTLAS